MNLQTLIGPEFTVMKDGRAERRDAASTPESILVESSYRVGERGKQIDEFLRSNLIPVAFVDADANVWQLTAGGSGLVIFESADGSPLSDEQGKAVDATVAALEARFNLSKPAPKKKVKKQVEPDVVLGTGYPEDVEILEDGGSDEVNFVF